MTYRVQRKFLDSVVHEHLILFEHLHEMDYQRRPKKVCRLFPDRRSSGEGPETVSIRRDKQDVTLACRSVKRKTLILPLIVGKGDKLLTTCPTGHTQGNLRLRVSNLTGPGVTS